MGAADDTRKLVRERLRPHGDVSGSEADHKVARLGQFGDPSGKVLRRVKRVDMAMAAGTQASNQAVPVCAFDRLLSGSIDIRDDHPVRIIEAGAEIVEQIVQAGIAVRLYHGIDPAIRTGGPGGGQHGTDLHRMMAIIVYNGNATRFTDLGKAPLDAAEPGE